MREEFKVIKADRSYEPVFHNLFEFYLHDMAEWFKFDQLATGNYSDTTESYWAEDHQIYLLYAGEIPIGFAVVGPADEWLPDITAKDMDEFFVVRRHRGTGLAFEFASYVWRCHPGPWLVRVFQPNLPALPFWRRSVSNFSESRYEEEICERNGNLWSHFTFESRDA